MSGSFESGNLGAVLGHGHLAYKKLLVGNGASKGADAGSDERPTGQLHRPNALTTLAARERNVRKDFPSRAITLTADNANTLWFGEAAIHTRAVTGSALGFHTQCHCVTSDKAGWLPKVA